MPGPYECGGFGPDFARKLADLGVLCQFLALPSCNPYKNSIV